MKLMKLGIASILAAGALYAGTFQVDKSHSTVGFKVKHMVVATVNGKFNDFSGTFEYDEKTNKLKSLNGVVEVKSIDTENEKRDNHLKQSDFFAADEYPKITFDLEKVDGDKAYGKLTMRGVTKNIVLDVETAGAVIEDPWGNKRTGLTLEGKLDRFDYGIKYNSVLEAGGLAVGKEIKLIVELEGILK